MYYLCLHVLILDIFMTIVTIALCEKDLSMYVILSEINSFMMLGYVSFIVIHYISFGAGFEAVLVK